MAGTPFLSKKPAIDSSDSLSTEPPSATDGPASGATSLHAIVVITVMGVITGLGMWAFNSFAYKPWSDALAILIGPAGGALLIGFWLWQGVLTRLVIPVKGAAFFGSLIAATVSAFLGSQWGGIVLLYGAAQGLGAELVFLAAGALRPRLLQSALIAALAGVGASLFSSALDLTVYYTDISVSDKQLYALCAMMSGAVIGGLFAWVLFRAILRTGAIGSLQPVNESDRV